MSLIEEATMSAELEARIAALEAEIARLHAKEGVTATFNRYLYGLDTGYPEDVLDAYADDAVLDVINFPPEGVDMHFEGRDAIAPLYASYAERKRIAGGHNAANVAIAVGPGNTTASLTAYFTTTHNLGAQGGRYEGDLRLDPDGRWRFTRLDIISAWGFRAETTPLSEHVPLERSRGAGKSATHGS
jgi:hypothetical protein